MSEFQRMTPDTAGDVFKKLKKLMEEDDTAAEDICDRMNAMLDELYEEDFFGTEGQTDPRGDHRD